MAILCGDGSLKGKHKAKGYQDFQVKYLYRTVIKVKKNPHITSTQKSGKGISSFS